MQGGEEGAPGVPLRACAAAGVGGLAPKEHHRPHQGPARERQRVRVLLGVCHDWHGGVHGGHGHRQGAVAQRAAGAALAVSGSDAKGWGAAVVNMAACMAAMLTGKALSLSKLKVPASLCQGVLGWD